MRSSLTVALSVAGLVLMSGSSFAQQTLKPGASGADPITRGTGVGPDSAQTGYSQSGRFGNGDRRSSRRLFRPAVMRRPSGAFGLRRSFSR